MAADIFLCRVRTYEEQQWIYLIHFSADVLKTPNEDEKIDGKMDDDEDERGCLVSGKYFFLLYGKENKSAILIRFT